MTTVGVARIRHKQPEMLARLAEANKRLAFVLIALLCILALSIALNIVQAGRPANVILVDKLGNAAFHFEAASPEPPQDYEIEAFAKAWVRDFLSRDGVTAKEDLARALTVSHPELQAKLKTQLLDSGELDKARDAFVRTSVRCQRVSARRVAEDRTEVEIDGARTFTAMGATSKSVTEPFRMSLVLQRVRRTETTPNGLVVRFVAGDFSPKDEAVANSTSDRIVR